MRGLYAIVDLPSLMHRSLDALRFAEALLTAPLGALQLRDKNVASGSTLPLLRQLRSLTREAGVALFANDRPDLALLAECDGVHLGQNDLPVAEAKRLATIAEQPLQVGLSVHDEQQLAIALDSDPTPDYIAFGPVFATRSKANPDPALGLDRLSALADHARRFDLPTVAIGGIDEAHAADVARSTGCVAVIGALLPHADSSDPYAEVQQRAAAMCETLESWIR